MKWLMRLFGRERLDRELDRELHFHVDEEARRLEASGVVPVEARRGDLAAFGGPEPIREQARDARGTRWLEDLVKDVRYAVRMMRRSPAFTLAAILSLAVGIGANAAVFGIADALLLRTLDVPRPGELYFLNRAGYDAPNLRFSHPVYERLARDVPGATFAAMGANVRMQADRGDGAKLVVGQLVSGGWFDLLGVTAAAGRLLATDDTANGGGPPVVVLSHAFWVREFAADPAVVGSTVTVNGTPLSVIGVARSGFTGLTVGERVDLWVPVTLQQALRYRSNASIDDADESQPWLSQEGIRWLTIVARVPPASLAAASGRIASITRADIERRAAGVADADQRAYLLREHVELMPGALGLSSIRDGFSQPLVVLMVTVAAVLLIACANLASLLLARSAARGRELALRVSLGAGRGRLVRQLLTESVTLACLGGLAGLGVARLGSSLLLRLASSGPAPLPIALPLDWRFLGFMAATSLLTGLLFGLGPALRASRGRMGDALRPGGRVTGAASRGGRFTFGRALIVAQVALSLVLLSGAVLFMRTFQNLVTADTGFDRTRVVSARFDPVLAGVPEDELPALYARLLDRARAIPGVSRAAMALKGPVTGSARVSGVSIDRDPYRPGDEGDVREEYVSAGYFETVGMPVIAGRTFVEADDERHPQVALVNETMARHFFGDRDPLGHHFGYGEPTFEIVGVVRDAHIDGMRRVVPPMAFYPLAQHPDEFAQNLYVRVNGPTDAVRNALRGAVVGADPRLAVREIVTLEELAERTVATNRLVSELTAGFGLLAMMVACLGLYGTVSYSVARRTNEIGVRMALGATAGRVRWLVLRETLSLLVVGSAIGLTLAIWALGYAGTLLYGLSPRDPAALAGATTLLIAIGLVAGAIPAWRASRLSPTLALRTE
jgi:predicted permease